MLNHLVNIVHSIIREKVVKKVTRSSAWPKVEKAHLASQNFCAACGGKDRLQVHHCVPFHDDPSLELNPSNLITLCMGNKFECHLKIGHGGSFKQFNPTVIADCAIVTLHPERRPEIEQKALTTRKVNEPGN